MQMAPPGAQINGKTEVLNSLSLSRHRFDNKVNFSPRREEWQYLGQISSAHGRRRLISLLGAARDAAAPHSQYFYIAPTSSQARHTHCTECYVLLEEHLADAHSGRPWACVLCNGHAWHRPSCLPQFTFRTCNPHKGDITHRLTP